MQITTKTMLIIMLNVAIISIGTIAVVVHYTSDTEEDTPTPTPVPISTDTLTFNYEDYGYTPNLVWDAGSITNVNDIVFILNNGRKMGFNDKGIMDEEGHKYMGGYGQQGTFISRGGDENIINVWVQTFDVDKYPEPGKIIKMNIYTCEATQENGKFYAVQKFDPSLFFIELKDGMTIQFDNNGDILRDVKVTGSRGLYPPLYEKHDFRYAKSFGIHMDEVDKVVYLEYNAIDKIWKGMDTEDNEVWESNDIYIVTKGVNSENILGYTAKLMN